MLLIVVSSFRMPVLFILRGCGLMWNDDCREAAEWVGVHMLCSTGNPPLVYTYSNIDTQMHACVRAALPPALEEPCSLNVQCPLSVNISSISALIWQNRSRAQATRQGRNNYLCTRPASQSSLKQWVFLSHGSFIFIQNINVYQLLVSLNYNMVWLS